MLSYVAIHTSAQKTKIMGEFKSEVSILSIKSKLMKHKMFIFGGSSFAEIAAEYFDRTGSYEVLGHLVDPEFHTVQLVAGRPQFSITSPEGLDLLQVATHFYVASTYTQLNRLRTKKYHEFRSKGLIPASYISPNAFIDPTVNLGEHCFIFENNVVQFGSSIRDNCVLWSGNHVGHHSIIQENVFVSSQVVISGHCSIGANSFLGVNSSIYNNVEIGIDNWIGPNSVVAKSTNNNVMMRTEITKPSQIATTDFFKIDS